MLEQLSELDRLNRIFKSSVEDKPAQHLDQVEETTAASQPEVVQTTPKPRRTAPTPTSSGAGLAPTAKQLFTTNDVGATERSKELTEAQIP